MSRATLYFDLDCPTCGRPLQIRVNLLGKPVKCRHCRAAFNASPDVQERGANLWAESTNSQIAGYTGAIEQRATPDSDQIERLLKQAEQFLANGDPTVESYPFA